MNLGTNINQNHGVVIGQIGWKYYHSIKKKAMEQEFSWSGLFVSLSIAFFIVIMAALTLSFFYQSLQQANLGFMNQNQGGSIEQIRQSPVLNTHYFENINKNEIMFQILV